MGTAQNSIGFHGPSKKVGPTEYVKLDGLVNMGTADKPELVSGGVLAWSPGQPIKHMTEKAAEAMQAAATEHIQHHGMRGFFNIAWSLPGAVFDHMTRWVTDKYKDPVKTLDRFRKDQVIANANATADALRNCQQQLNTVALHPDIEPLLTQRRIMEAKGNPNDPLHLTDMRNNARQINAVIDQNPQLQESLLRAEAFATAARSSQAEFFQAAKQANIANPFERLNISSDELNTLSKLSESLGADKIGEHMRGMLDQFQEAWTSVSESIQQAIQQLFKPGG
jgi:hypothetical protein